MAMHTYGQYCPVAMAVEVLGDRWTLLIVRDLLTGTSHFNDLQRGLPGISRGLLAKRLRRLERSGVLEKIERADSRRRTEYRLTQAGLDLQSVINALLIWGVAWAFDEPRAEDLDPLLLMWWMHQRVVSENLPADRVVVQFDFTEPRKESYWLLLSREDVSICVSPPGFPVDVLVTARLPDLFQVWLGRREYGEALAQGRVQVDSTPALARAFPTWFAYSPAAPAVRAVN